MRKEGKKKKKEKPLTHCRTLSQKPENESDLLVQDLTSRNASCGWDIHFQIKSVVSQEGCQPCHLSKVSSLVPGSHFLYFMVYDRVSNKSHRDVGSTDTCL
jgi:hypothetical protein